MERAAFVQVVIDDDRFVDADAVGDPNEDAAALKGKCERGELVIASIYRRAKRGLESGSMLRSRRVEIGDDDAGRERWALPCAGRVAERTDRSDLGEVEFGKIVFPAAAAADDLAHGQLFETRQRIVAHLRGDRALTVSLDQRVQCRLRYAADGFART